MPHDHAGRLARAAQEAAAAELDALIVTPSPDLQYLLGYEAPLLERLTALVARAGGEAVLVVPELERPRAAATPAGALLPIETWRDGEDPFELIQRLLPAGGTYGVSDRMWAMHLLPLHRVLPRSTFVPASTVMTALRVRKDAGEIELLETSAHDADRAFAAQVGEHFAGRTEREVAATLTGHLLREGIESVAFCIVGSGPNGASPHHEPGAREVRAGDAVVLDFGGRVGGYCSDITRSVRVGEAAAEVEEVHAIVHEAQEAAFRAVRPGVAAQEIDRAARKVVEDAGYGHAFFHRTGHGIGLEEHEHPYLVDGNAEPLEPGMCFSIEPGIYLEGRFGIRIEDIVTVTTDGGRRLNLAPRELAAVR